MQKVILLLVFVLVLFSPTLAMAQADSPVLDELIIQVWPEYDQPSMLVIYDFKLAEGTTLPVSLKLRVPKEGNIFAVAQETSEGLMNVQYEPPVTEGDYDVLTLVVSDLSYHRIEFYAPYQRLGASRQYSLLWPGDYAVTTLTTLVQKPVGVNSLVTEPSLAEMPAADGFVYAQGSFSNLPAGEPFTLSVQYEKDGDALSVNSQPPTLPGLEQPTEGVFSLTQALPWLAGGLGVVLIVGGLAWYWVSGRARKSGRDASRKRHASHTDSSTTQQIYCSQCGKRNEGNDRFCRACGAPLRRD
ncbi:MAG: hypothetical protein CVU44_01085 [Chloroflexi bacterium HGW-Chloroflexi-6]|nr:MAG: hypothetical protein CVU44_01085 [Chloroflexi bacterium HGW-Chloroflexi-6]